MFGLVGMFGNQVSRTEERIRARARAREVEGEGSTSNHWFFNNGSSYTINLSFYSSNSLNQPRNLCM